MQFIAIDRYFRKRSSSSSIFLHIPVINFLGFLFQLRGAYIAVKNYCYINKEIASFSKVIFIGLRFAFFGSFWSIFLLGFLFLFFDVNFVGPMLAYYLGVLGDVFGVFLPIEISGSIFGSVPSLLSSQDLNLEVFLTNSLFLILSYIKLGIIGSIWAIIDLKSDLRRSYARKSLFDVEPSKEVLSEETT